MWPGRRAANDLASRVVTRDSISGSSLRATLVPRGRRSVQQSLGIWPVMGNSVIKLPPWTACRALTRPQPVLDLELGDDLGKIILTGA